VVRGSRPLKRAEERFGEFVVRCPSCASDTLMTVAYQCLTCKTVFSKPIKRYFTKMSDAIKQYGTYETTATKKVYVDVCPSPQCGSSVMVQHMFRCKCGNAFDRATSKLYWEVPDGT